MRISWGVGTVMISIAAAGCMVALGIDKDYHLVGKGGGGGSSDGGGGGGGGAGASSGTTGAAEMPCPKAGELACAGNAQTSRLLCGTDGKWATIDPCDSGTLCDTAPGNDQGTCKPIVPVCMGKSPNEVICDGLKRVQCGPDLVTSTVIETCTSLCTPTGCMGQCAVGDKRCNGNTPQSCDANGTWQNGTACAAQTQVCVAGACATPPSCGGLAATCGAAGNESCCAITSLPGGTYDRINWSLYPATVSAFRLDRFEITVGRFRKFVAAYPGSKPAAGAGAHPRIAGSGWDSTWDPKLPANLAAAVKCDSALATWTDAPGANEDYPINCITWYEAFAFCAWDGGRLPTEAEFNYAEAGGGEQRDYAWGSGPLDANHAAYDCLADGSPAGQCAFTDILKVGSRPPGDGKWGQADLSGNVAEWMLDSYAHPYTIVNCQDCAFLGNDLYRASRGAGFDHPASTVGSGTRWSAVPEFRAPDRGVRCARNL